MVEELRKRISAIYNADYPQLLTDSGTPGFITDLINIFFTDPIWLKLTLAEKVAKVTLVMVAMEEAGELTSKVCVVKKRHFEDDEVPPSLSKRVRFYSRGKNRAVLA